jgi:hypothetical protein
MDYQKAERVAYRISIRDLRSFGQSETQKLRSVQLLFGTETEFKTVKRIESYE